MNRLIIIGNGFDLAHGVKTSYHDFILDYMKTSCLKAINDGVKNTTIAPYKSLYHIDDTLTEISIANRNSASVLDSEIKRVKTIFEFNKLYKKLGIEIKYHFEMLKKGVEKLTEYNWVDFEIEYFNELHKIKSKGINVENNIIKLNTAFEIFKTKLEYYLRIQQDRFENNFDNNELINCFCEDIFEKDVDIVTITGNQTPKRMLFLNFNFTNTLETYYNDCKLIIPSDINYIHGSLNQVLNKPIFGFGDEIDKRYTEFENEVNNELFKHIKTFQYLKYNNYSNLTRFLAIEQFQVHIYGHSCGLSDRTMLKEIFEHNNCLSIKIFYHEKDGINDYTDKTYEIYRHFSDKNSMRNKIVNEQYCSAMPQPIDLK